MISLFLSLLLILPQQFVEPVKVSVTTTDDDESSVQLVREAKAELRSLRYVAIVEKNADVVVVVMAAKVEGCTGYAATMFAGSGRDKKHDRASMHTAVDLQTLANRLVAKLDKEFLRVKR